MSHVGAELKMGGHLVEEDRSTVAELAKEPYHYIGNSDSILT